MGISFSSGDSVTRILPLMMRRCMHTCTDTVRSRPPLRCSNITAAESQRGVCSVYLTCACCLGLCASTALTTQKPRRDRPGCCQCVLSQLRIVQQLMRPVSSMVQEGRCWEVYLELDDGGQQFANANEPVGDYARDGSHNNLHILRSSRKHSRCKFHSLPVTQSATIAASLSARGHRSRSFPASIT